MVIIAGNNSRSAIHVQVWRLRGIQAPAAKNSRPKPCNGVAIPGRFGRPGRPSR